MYTTYGTGFGKFSQTYHIGTRKYGHKPGHQEQKEKKTPSSRKPHGFSEHENTFHRSRPVCGE